MGDPLGCTWMGGGFREENVRPCGWTMIAHRSTESQAHYQGQKSTFWAAALKDIAILGADSGLQRF